MSFPWTNFITAGSTLLGAFGGASLTALTASRADGRRHVHERHLSRMRERTDAYSHFLDIAYTDARFLALSAIRFSRGIPAGDEATRMINEADELVTAFNQAHARVEIVGSEEAILAANKVSELCRSISDQLRDTFLAGVPMSPAPAAEQEPLNRAIDAFAAHCRRELRPD
ncbi:hypothetical protein ACFOY4_31235 [Actinomadura syzygii]|uniref:Uncharacterized protein n=1 Tax=Actinomadura syzygii TaxID=1427538 RepID=A0A5D0UA07_9ACTN|nr:hypothetical protein [Actinomadura syzygii]TYC15391.1 hypothetical protein FXF65_15120 [Actinomadura syzygii]